MERRTLLLSILALPLFAACQSSMDQPSVDVQQTTTLVGVIETVDLASREVLLRGPIGSLSMVAGRAVQHLDQLRPGDRVTVTYFRGLVAQAVPPLAGTAQPPFSDASVAREAGRPGGEMTRVHAGRVTITAIDSAAGSITFVGPNYRSRTVVPKNPEVQAFVRSLRVGDRVDLVYEEALAISITPAR